MNGCVKRHKRDFASWVRNVREANAWSLKDVADKAGGKISKPYISFIETRRVMPLNITLKKLIGLADGLKIPPRAVIEAALKKPAKRLKP